MSIDRSDEQENADDSIRINRELIQMKLIKVIYNMRNMMIQEFQHFVEFQFIQAMKMKMQMI
jgi:hypothetical protein